MKARVTVQDRDVLIDLRSPVSLAREVNFSAAEPGFFGAPPASSQPLTLPGFSGSVQRGASCNCNTLTLTPHCNGTHTECVGHITLEPLDAHRVTPVGFLPAVLVSVKPVHANSVSESTDPAPQSADLLITRAALEQRWPSALPFAPKALILRTQPQAQQHDTTPAPYLTRAAAELLVERGIEHLVVDLPSVDRTEDQGRLTAHRTFFGLPPGSTQLAAAVRARATITELAHIPETVAPGPYLLELQVPALGGDAVPSRPLVYPLLES